MDFRLRKDARNWFKGLDAVINSSAKNFEYYYFCLCAGLISGNKSEIATSDSDQLVNYYPGEYRQRGRILNAWLISKELESLGIDVSERTRVHEAIHQLVDPLSPTSLSDHGVQQMNRYAAGGFEVLSENILEPPRVVSRFLIEFQRLIQEVEARDRADEMWALAIMKTPEPRQIEIESIERRKTINETDLLSIMRYLSDGWAKVGVQRMTGE